MASFRLNGFTYDLYVKPWKGAKSKYEAIKWKTGLKCTWERISFDEFEAARKLSQKGEIRFVKVW